MSGQASEETNGRKVWDFFIYFLVWGRVGAEEGTEQMQGRKAAAAANEMAEMQHNGGNSDIKSVAENRWFSI